MQQMQNGSEKHFLKMKPV